MIRIVCAAGNRELKTIRLGGNQLTDLAPEFFSKQVFLRDLSLAANQFRNRDTTNLIFNEKKNEKNIASSLFIKNMSIGSGDYNYKRPLIKGLSLKILWGLFWPTNG